MSQQNIDYLDQMRARFERLSQHSVELFSQLSVTPVGDALKSKINSTKKALEDTASSILILTQTLEILSKFNDTETIGPPELHISRNYFNHVAQVGKDQAATSSNWTDELSLHFKKAEHQYPKAGKPSDYLGPTFLSEPHADLEFRRIAGIDKEPRVLDDDEVPVEIARYKAQRRVAEATRERMDHETALAAWRANRTLLEQWRSTSVETIKNLNTDVTEEELKVPRAHPAIITGRMNPEPQG